MERPNDYELHTTINYCLIPNNGIATRSQLKKWAIQAEKMHKYINHLEERLAETTHENSGLHIADVTAMLPSDDFIEENGKDGGLQDDELQMFWEGAVWLRGYLQKKIKAKGN